MSYSQFQHFQVDSHLWGQHARSWGSISNLWGQTLLIMDWGDIQSILTPHIVVIIHDITVINPLYQQYLLSVSGPGLQTPSERLLLWFATEGFASKPGPGEFSTFVTPKVRFREGEICTDFSRLLWIFTLLFTLLFYLFGCDKAWTTGIQAVNMTLFLQLNLGRSNHETPVVLEDFQLDGSSPMYVVKSPT